MYSFDEPCVRCQDVPAQKALLMPFLRWLGSGKSANRRPLWFVPANVLGRLRDR
jgi:hypothetical protein